MAAKKTTNGRTAGTGGSKAPAKKKAVRKKAVAKKTASRAPARKKSTAKKTAVKKKAAAATKKTPMSPATAPRAGSNGDAEPKRGVATGRPSDAPRPAATPGGAPRWSDRFANLLIRHADATRALAERLRRRAR